MMRVSLKILRRSLRPVSISCETSEIVNVPCGVTQNPEQTQESFSYFRSKMDKKIEPTGLPLQAGNDSTITNCGFRNVCFRFGRGHLKNRHRSQCYPCASWL